MPAPTKADIINRFNTIVRNGQSSVGFATYHSGNFPNPILRPGASPLGSRTEPTRSASEITVTGVMATNIFEILHNFAMEMTRVRRARNTHLVDNRSDSQANHSVPGSWTLTALHPRHALYFDIPGGHRNFGTPVSASAIDSFLNQLRIRVQDIRNGQDYGFEIISCHSSCHSSCHGSRARR